MNPLLIEMDVEIRRPVDEVFAAWATASAMATWFAPMAASRPTVTMNFEVNGAYAIEISMADGAEMITRGVFREIVPGKRIVMTWHCSAFPDPETVVEVDFEETPDGTVVRLRHERFESRDTCENHRGGWDACLAALKNILEI